jgi:hypothetical protein
LQHIIEGREAVSTCAQETGATEAYRPALHKKTAGELFGFDRTSAIAADTAESIAQAAQKFGQQDDITVLTLGRSHGDGVLLGQRAAAASA